MTYHQRTRLHRSLLTVALLGSVAVSLVTPHSTSAAGHVRPKPKPWSPPTLAPGSDIARLDTPTEHHIQADNGNIRLHLYNSPVGHPDKQGWHDRSSRLGSSSQAGKLMPGDVPFDLQLAANSSDATLASLKSETGVTLGLGLASIDGATPAAVAGKVQDNAITYPAPVSSSPSDVSFKATAQGLDAQVILHSAQEARNVIFSLSPDPRTQLAQDPDGTIRATRPITFYGDNGQPDVVIQTEYYLEPASALDSSEGTTATVSSSPVTMTLVSTSSGGPGVALTVDRSWLTDPARVFPVRVDMPVWTAYGGADTRVFDTVNSCAPDTRGPLTGVVAGSVGSCAYHGQLRFNVASLLPGTPIISATLRLYTPDQTGDTGVQVFQNAPAGDPSQPLPLAVLRRAAQRPTWNTAPAVITGTTGLVQNGSEGHWQSWDVTSIVDQWVQNGRTNNGLTLIGSGAPVLFASSQGAGDSDPAVAPSLNIMYAPPTATSTGPAPRIASSRATSRVSRSATYSYNDGQYYVYGIANTFDSCGSSVTDGFTTECPGYVMNVASVGTQLSGSFVRFPVQMPCPGASGERVWDAAYRVMGAAYANSLTPVADLVPPGAGQCVLTPDNWYSEAQDFIRNAHASPYGIPNPVPATYFEIGNEPNINGGQYPDYPNEYALAARALYACANPNCSGLTWPFYRLVTAGVVAPTTEAAYTSGCDDVTTLSIDYAQEGVSTAENNNIPASYLSVAVHPYGYQTQNYYWANYHDEGYSYQGPCRDLAYMNQIWTSDFPNTPILYTEVNFDSGIGNFPASGDPSLYYKQEGAYLADLFTYFTDHNLNITSSSPYRVMWDRGIDNTYNSSQCSGGQCLDFRGIYDANGNDKNVPLAYCPNLSSFYNGAESFNESDIYANLVSYACY